MRLTGARLDFINAIETPVEDVREIKRGKWILYKTLFSDTLCCSECGFNVLPEEAEVYQFCPHCGANMRGEVSERL